LQGELKIIQDVKIMVVDDDTQIRDLTVTALTYCVNREVMSFEDPLSAWDYIQKGNRVDIVISDVDMPQIDGFELMSRVKQKYPEKIFIIMSGIAAYEEKSRVQGANAFLAKPFGINDLFDIVQHYVVA